ncbi:MAG: hypothetical protein LUC19_00630, partial [Oscillospiraceae bacterium]|nr:hypothetical protein [Oscillospiraceae bacterium]
DRRPRSPKLCGAFLCPRFSQTLNNNNEFMNIYLFSGKSRVKIYRKLSLKYGLHIYSGSGKI